ncbi:tellurite resistance TerB family protein [Vibrio genomosp. F6]|uniref:tellurite resistance TerB family protein n=1 Tax=Vibrio genomosp. F6 TaxID=723172 RepID=UPI0010BD3DE9|nr:tellurite resistance TerB family protein [Vibrio genomosp. F6]TKF20530.1 tellurite resistance TerB family protein [Vibrio genomosp. F6]
MNLTSLLNQALNSDIVKQGKEQLSQASSSSSNTLNSLTKDKSQLATLGVGAVGGGILGLLMGSKKTRKMGKKAIGVTSAAALGALAFKVYKDWQSNQPASAPSALETSSTSLDASNHSTSLTNEEKQNTLILQAMIAAAKADGHVDEQEQHQIQQAVEALGADPSVNLFVQQELSKPLDPAEIATLVSSPEEAAEVYLASLLVADEQNFMEKAYLQELAKQLNLAPDLVAQLSAQISE